MMAPPGALFLSFSRFLRAFFSTGLESAYFPWEMFWIFSARVARLQEGNSVECETDQKMDRETGPVGPNSLWDDKGDGLVLSDSYI